MPLNIETHQLLHFVNLESQKQLLLDVGYQRRQVWNNKKKQLLIDSIARRIPINAITLYKTKDDGITVFEVIDGKQRLSTIFEFLNDEIVVRSDIARKDLEEEGSEEEKDLAESIHDKKFSDIGKGDQFSFKEYKIPVYIIEGSKSWAVSTFKRINEDPFSLKPQEIRNAVYRDSLFNITAINLSQELDSKTKLYKDDPFFAAWGLMSVQEWSRMQDIQFVSELLAMAYSREPQTARKTLNDFYEDFRLEVSEKKKKDLNKSVVLVLSTINVILEILGEDLKYYHMDSENNLYCLVGAFFINGIPSKAQLRKTELTKNLRKAVSAFMDDVEIYKQALQNNKVSVIEEFKENTEVCLYAGTLMSGQINDSNRRKTRIDILSNIIQASFKPIDAKKITERIRRLVWAMSEDKKCARCRKTVESYVDYNCGHIVSRATGGKVAFDNLRVEHESCNKSAGGSDS